MSPGQLRAPRDDLQCPTASKTGTCTSHTSQIQGEEIHHLFNAYMYIFIVMAEKVKKMFEVNVILVHAYENIKPISFA